MRRYFSQILIKATKIKFKKKNLYKVYATYSKLLVASRKRAIPKPAA